MSGSRNREPGETHRRLSGRVVWRPLSDGGGVHLDGLAAKGREVLIDPWVRIIRPDLVHIGDHVRIDAGVLLSGLHPIRIGDHVHLAAGTKIFSSGGLVEIASFASLSADVKVYSASDDYTGGSLTNPTVPDAYKAVTRASVRIGKHTIIGAGSVVLPGVTLGFGSAVGALSLVSGDVEEGVVVAGVPARSIGRRDTARLVELEAMLKEGLVP